GIDPGIHGGLAIIDVINGAAPQLIDAIDVPIVGVKAKERVDALGIRAWIEAHKPIDHAAIERAGSMQEQGVASTVKYGAAYGAHDSGAVQYPLSSGHAGQVEGSLPSRRRQREVARARDPTLAGLWLLRFEKASRTRRGCADRALRRRDHCNEVRRT